MSLSGYSVPESLTDDAGNALKSITVAVTGPSSYTGTATTDATTGVLRLGPLPVGDYTVTYRGRSVTVPVVAAAADIQTAFDLASAAETPTGAQAKATAAQTAAIAAAATDAASRVSAEATARDAAIAAQHSADNATFAPKYYALRPARPDGVDQSFHLVASGSGATATQMTPGSGNAQGLTGYRFYTPNANTVAYAKSGPLGHFEIVLGQDNPVSTNALILAAQTGTTGILAVVPCHAVTPASPLSPAALEIQYSYASSQTFTVYGVGAAGSRVTIGSLSQASSTVTEIRVRRDAVGYRVQFTQANGTVTVLRPRTKTDLSDAYEGTVILCLGKLENGSGTADVQLLVKSFVRTPADAANPFLGLSSPVNGPLRGCNDFQDALLNTELNRTMVQRRDPNLALTYDWLIASSVTYQAFGSLIHDMFYRLPFIRDLGDTDFARKILLNHLTNVQSGGRIPAFMAPAGPTDPGSGRVWSQALFAQAFALLCHDGDTDWTNLGQSAGALYTVLKNHLTWWETNRLSGRGLFLMDNGQENGWDGAINTNPSADPSVTPNRFEPVILNCNMYLEYQAMIGIATQRGNSADAATYTAKAAALKTAIQAHLWSNSGGWLFAYDTTLSALSPNYQADAIYGLWAGVLTDAQAKIVRDRLVDPAHFLCNYGITTLDKTDGGYDIVGYSGPGAWQTNWNGPVWEPPIYLAAIGLARYGYAEDAFEIARRGANLYKANLTNSDAYGLIGEWHDPDTGLADPNSHKPFYGWMLLAVRAYLDLARNYDPFLIQTTGTARATQPYTRAIA